MRCIWDFASPLISFFLMTFCYDGTKPLHLKETFLPMVVNEHKLFIVLSIFLLNNKPIGDNLPPIYITSTP